MEGIPEAPPVTQAPKAGVSEVQGKPRLKEDTRKGRYVMRFVVASEVFELFPDLKLPVAVAQGIHPTPDAPGIETMWRQSREEAARTASDYQSPQSHPQVAPRREAMTAMGVSGRKFPSSIEDLLRRAFKGGEPLRINPLVDFYNVVSLWKATRRNDRRSPLARGAAFWSESSGRR